MWMLLYDGFLLFQIVRLSADSSKCGRSFVIPYNTNITSNSCHVLVVGYTHIQIHQIVQRHPGSYCDHTESHLFFLISSLGISSYLAKKDRHRQLLPHERKSV